MRLRDKPVKNNSKINLRRTIIISASLVLLTLSSFFINAWYSENIKYKNIIEKSNNVWFAGDDLKLKFNKWNKNKSLLFAEQLKGNVYNLYYKNGLILQINIKEVGYSSEIITSRNKLNNWILALTAVIFSINGFLSMYRNGHFIAGMQAWSEFNQIEKEIFIHCVAIFVASSVGYIYLIK